MNFSSCRRNEAVFVIAMVLRRRKALRVCNVCALSLQLFLRFFLSLDITDFALLR